MQVVPEPDEGDIPINEALTRMVTGGSKLIATFKPEQQTTTFRLPSLGISKHPSTTYEVRADGNNVYGPAPIPPTDVDDLVTTWCPALTFQRKLQVIVRNVGDQDRYYTIQPVGYEEVDA
ncbi:hypothetical protein ACFQMA_09270 [Halosimplex aquaticum]|uniref:Uncharacterized protein n=1 Tax=Halosimplex aquaticum TaxID=3026162 RepID=A0ABD5XY10_9EURY|nr:hypothetical protein [Halosimplex aquaticum]